jgi:peptidyl-prolyl cis-trans isomerase A (cyclophilin A)
MTDALARRTLLTGALALAAGPALAQTDTGLVRIALKTSKGVITLDLNVGKAPITAGNFLRYVDRRLLDGTTFYRVSQVKGVATPNGFIQGGQRDAAKQLKAIAHESTLKTGLSHKDGTISMAARAPGEAKADFFICVGDQPSMDADAQTGAAGFAAFGQVVEGMDVVRAILAAPTSPTAGIGVMRGEMLSPQVPVLTARRVAA